MTFKVKEEQLTAYVLNELSDKEHDKIEKIVQNDPELMLEVEMIREFCCSVKTELTVLDQNELPALTVPQRRTIMENLNVEPVVERFSLRRFFQWKVMVPAMCVPVLALAFFLNFPGSFFSFNDTVNVAQFDSNRESYVSSSTRRSQTVGKIVGVDRNQNYYGQNNALMNRVTSNYSANNRGGLLESGNLFDGNFRIKGNSLNRYNSTRQMNKRVGYVSPQYNLENYEIVFKDSARPKTNNSRLLALPVNVNSTGYDTVRQFIKNKQFPPVEMVKGEEMINFFDYNYSPPEGAVPFSVTTEVSKAPWNNKHKLLHIGIKGKSGRTGDPYVNVNAAIAARDVKIRLEFDPDKIKAYRLVGYSKRSSGGNGFNHDSEIYIKDLYEGHIATVLYELIPATGTNVDKDVVNSLADRRVPKTDSMMTMKLGYKLPERGQWHVVMYPVMERYVPVGQTSDNFRFAASVAGFGMLLKNSDYNKELSYSDVINIASGAIGKDRKGYRSEFVRIVEMAKALDSKN